MRIAHVVPRGEQPWSGVLTVIVHLSAALSREGHDVEVWQLHAWGPEYSGHHQTMQSAGVTARPVAINAPWWRVGRAVGRYAEARDVDIVHLHGSFNVWNTLVSRSLQRPYVFSPHSGLDPVSLQRSRVRKALYWLLFERTMLQRAALLVALTDIELAQLRDRGALGAAVVIPNGVASTNNGVDPVRFRKELGIEPHTLLALFVGRLDMYRKGLDRLVEEIARAPEWHLAMVGPRFRDVSKLEAMIESLGVGDRVHFRDARYGKRLKEALAAADVFTMLSRWEGLPMALLEALSAGKPAVVSPAVGRLVPIAASGAGWVATGGDLSPVLREVAAAGPSELEQRGNAARLLARRYEWDSVARQYDLAYKSALGVGGQ